MSTTLTHIALHVPQLEPCIAFYQDFCGMRVIHERAGKGSKIVWMAEPGKEHQFIFVIMPGGNARDLPLSEKVIYSDRHNGFRDARPDRLILPGPTRPSRR